MNQVQLSHVVDYCVIVPHSQWPAKYNPVARLCTCQNTFRTSTAASTGFQNILLKQGRHGGLVKPDIIITKLFFCVFPLLAGRVVEGKKKKITSSGQPTSLIARGRASATLPNVKLNVSVTSR